MKTEQYTFLGDIAEELLLNFKNEAKKSAKAISDFPIRFQSTNPKVISIGKLNILLDKAPFIIGNQVVESKLASVQVYGFEREDFENRRSYAGNAKTFLKKFSDVNSLSENIFYELLEADAISFNDAQNQKGKFILLSDLQASVPLRLLIAHIRYCADGHNAWWGIYSTDNIHDLHAQLDTADKLAKASTIIPIDVYRDAIEIVKIVDLLDTITNFLITGRCNSRFESVDVEADRTILEKLLSGLIEKYPFLSTENYQKFGALLLNAYTMSPGLLIERMGPGTVCFPYDVPGEFELPKNEKIEWSEISGEQVEEEDNEEIKAY